MKIITDFPDNKIFTGEQVKKMLRFIEDQVVWGGEEIRITEAIPALAKGIAACGDIPSQS